MLAQHEILPYLLGRELVNRQTIVEDGLTIEDVSRHNRNFTVTSDDAPSYLIKQGGAATGFATVAYEAAMLARFQAVAGHALSPYLPRRQSYDAGAGVLILELLRDARDLRAWHNRHGRFPRSLAAQAGEMLATLHAMPLPAQDDDVECPISRRIPPVLSLHRPSLAMIQSVSGGNLRLISLIQRFPDLCDLIEAARVSWRPDSLIHGDARWDNVLVVREQAAKRTRSTLRLIDWESASIGDPCWDAGSFMSEYIGHWLLSIPTVGDLPPDRLVGLARVPLARVQPALRAFWRAYAHRLDLASDDEREWRYRAVRFAAIRLIDRACELMDGASRLTGTVFYLLQTSLNMLQRPDAAARDLLGIAAEKGDRA